MEPQSLELARRYLLEGHPKEAVAAALMALEEARDAREKLSSYLILFQAYLLLGNLRKAHGLLSSPIRDLCRELGLREVFRSFKAIFYLAQGENCMALEILRDMGPRERFPASYALALLREGENWEEAIEIYRTLGYDLEGSQENIASIMIAQGRLSEAIETLERLMERLIRRSHLRVMANASLSLALAWSGLGDVKKALMYLEFAELTASKSQIKLTIPVTLAVKSILMPELEFPKSQFSSATLNMLKKFKEGDVPGAWEAAKKHCIKGLFAYYLWALPAPLREEALDLVETQRQQCLPQLLLFGRPRLAVKARERPLPRNRAGRLILFFGLHRNISKEETAKVLWPGNERAMRNYYKVVSEARAWLKELGLQPAREEGLGVEFWVDAVEFERLYKTAQNLESMGDKEGSSAIRERLLRVYRGPLADGFEEPWVLERREAFRKKVRSILEKLNNEDLALEVKTRDPRL